MYVDPNCNSLPCGGTSMAVFRATALIHARSTPASSVIQILPVIASLKSIRIPLLLIALGFMFVCQFATVLLVMTGGYISLSARYGLRTSASSFAGMIITTSPLSLTWNVIDAVSLIE